MDFQACCIFIVLSLTVINLTLILLTPVYLPDFPGSLDRPKFRQLYTVDILPPRFFMWTYWAIVYIGTTIFHGWWWKLRSKQNLPNLTIFHVGWIGGQVTLTCFTYTYSFGKLFYACAHLLLMNCTLIFATYGALQQRGKVQKKLTASQFSWYDILAVQLAPMFVVWTQQAVTFLGAAGLGYHGPVNQPTLSGLCDPRTTCGTMSLSGLILLFIGWVILDIFMYPSHTKHIKSVYPTFCYTAISVLSVKNRMWDGELRLNQWIYIGMAVASMVTWMFRGSLQTNFGKKEIKEE